MSGRLKSLLDERVGLKAAAEPKGHLSGKATIRPGDESAIELSLRSHPWLGLQGWTCVCFASIISRMTIIQASTSYFVCVSPAITAASLSSIWFQPSI
jgi:hypothetical protein